MLHKNKYTLAQLRRLKGLSQKELGETIGVSERTITSYESDVELFKKIQHWRLTEIARVLEVEISDIYIGEWENENIR